MTGYVRKDTTNNIADGNVINAADLDSEFDGVQDAFNASTGHKHDGTAGEGATINALGPTQDVTVSSTLLAPKTTNTVDIGSSALKFKDLFLAGNSSIGGTLAVTGVATFTAQPVLSALTASTALALDASKNIVSVTNTGSGSNVLATSPTLVTPVLGVATGTSFQGIIGNVTPAAGNFTTLGASSTATLNTLASSGATLTGGTINGMTIGATTASTGAFTTLSASSTVSGTGFSTYLASPPAIGGTAAAAGTFTTLTTSSTITDNGGTANGVTYLNGSKVVTSGSALTFDGTVVNNTGASPNFRSTITGGSYYTNLSADGIYASGTDLYLLAPATKFISFYANNAEAMRLTSTGLGIGISSPAYKLDVNGSGNILRIINSSTSSALMLATNSGASSILVLGNESTTAGSSATGSASYAGLLFTTGAKPLQLGTNSVIQATLDTSGNLGLGVTPSAWGSSKFAMQLGTRASLYGANNLTVLGNNYYDNGTNNIYIATAAATDYYQSAGTHVWRYAASGTAGNPISFTQAMTLDASGNLGVGTTSPKAPLQINTFGGLDGNGNQFYITNNQYYDSVDARDESIKAGYSNRIVLDNNSGGILFQTTSTSAAGANTAVTLSERARITSGGVFLVGTTSTIVSATEIAGFKGSRGISAQSTGGSANFAGAFWNDATTGDNVFVKLYTDTAGTERGSITYNRTGGLTVYNTTSDYRAKDISGPVTGSGALIDSVPVYMGKMKWATEERPMFIAHEVPAYAHTGEKDAVDADGNPVYQQMDASALIPVMWAEIQSLRQRLSAANL